MNQAFDQLCEKYELSEEIQTEFKNMFESEIIKVFYKMSIKENDIKKTTTTTKSTASKTIDSEICAGKKANGEDCTFKCKPNSEYCGRHNPDKLSSLAKTSKAKTKKSTQSSCNAIIPKTKKPCTQPGTVKPDNSEFHYCKRHSTNWIQFETPIEQEPNASDIEMEDKS